MMSLSIIYLLLIIFSDSFLWDGLSSVFCTFCNAFVFSFHQQQLVQLMPQSFVAARYFVQQLANKKKEMLLGIVLFSLAQKHQKQYNFLTWGGKFSRIIFFTPVNVLLYSFLLSNTIWKLSIKWLGFLAAIELVHLFQIFLLRFKHNFLYAIHIV